MTEHLDKTRARLGDLAGLAGKTEDAERRILASAEKRLKAVQTEIEGLGAVEFSPKEDRYTDLIAERGQLNVVIAKARRALA